MDIYEQILAQAEALGPKLTAYRRDFHTYAEPGWQEMRTSSLIARRLTDLGYEVLVGDAVCQRDSRMGVPGRQVLEAAYERAAAQGADPEFLEATRGGMTGVVGILRCGEGPTVALRFDIDALGVIEAQDSDHRPAREGFASVNHGTMHACGHDAHAASGLGVAEVLMGLRDRLHGTVKLLFQPAEEGVRGAKAMVDKGHLEGVDLFFAAHTSDNDPEGSDFSPGSYGSLATFKYDAVFHGKSAHAGGAPQTGSNALLSAATALLNLQAIPRHGEGASRINVGRLVGGSGRNVIADEALMEIEVRGGTTEINRYMNDYALRILEAAATMHGCTVDIKLMGAAESTRSDRDLAQYAARLVTEKTGLKASRELMIKAGGSEDVSYMMNRVQAQGGKACYLRIRTALSAPGHNRRFDLDEVYLTKAVKVFCTLVADALK